MPLPNSNEPSFGSWFNKRVVAPPPSDPAPSDAAPLALAELEGHPRWALALGAIGGAGGGAAMMFVAVEVARRLRLDADIIGTIGRGARPLGDDPFVVGLGVAIVIGSAVGMVFGVLMRHSVRLIARLLAGVLLAVVLWTFVHAFVFKSFAAASLGALPLGPMLAGATVFGICIALLRPPRRRVALETGS
jgi:hypothetical protein